jgi:hypothetical protein
MNMAAYKAKNKTDNTPLGAIHAVNGNYVDSMSTVCGEIVPCDGTWILTMGMATCRRCIKVERAMSISKEKLRKKEKIEQRRNKYNAHHAMTYRQREYDV